jgi:hypothetical protein
LKPRVLPAATETVADAGEFVLHLKLDAVVDVTGLLLTGWRTAAVEVVEPAMSVVQMST